MNLTSQEIEYLQHALETMNGWHVARGEQLNTPTVNHRELQRKLQDSYNLLHASKRLIIISITNLWTSQMQKLANFIVLEGENKEFYWYALIQTIFVLIGDL